MTDKHYTIFLSFRCSSYIGQIGGMQTISLDAEGCLDVGDDTTDVWLVVSMKFLPKKEDLLSRMICVFLVVCRWAPFFMKCYMLWEHNTNSPEVIEQITSEFAGTTHNLLSHLILI